MPVSFINLPTEVIDQIISHCYSPWSLHILDRNGRGTLPIDGLPPSTLLLVNRQFAALVPKYERLNFTGHLIFTTSSTQWRIVKRLPNAAPTRLGWILDYVETLVFCSPPLFTSRIPWSVLPRLQRIGLDYCYRSANFRCQGTAKELQGGYLDPMIVNFARDTERFDMPLVKDAWKVKDDLPLANTASGQQSVGARPVDGIEILELSDARRVEVLVIKRMNIFESPSSFHLPSLEEQTSAKLENWKVRVTATHRGRIEDIRFQILEGNHEVPFGEAIIWTAANGYRETIPFDELQKGQLKVRENRERERYLVDDV